MEKKVIVHVEDYFDPQAGYQLNDIVLSTQNNYSIVIICSYDMSPFHKIYNPIYDIEYEQKYKVKIVRLRHLFKLSSRIFYGKLFSTINLYSPDLVYLHGIGDFKDLILFFKKRRFIVIRDCHMSNVATKNRYSKVFYFFYSIFFSHIINRTSKYKFILALGNEEHLYLKKIGISDHKIYFFYHGYNKNIIYYSLKEAYLIKEKYEIPKSNLIISYIGKLDFSKRPDIILDIIDNLFKIDSNLLLNITIMFIGNFEEKYKSFFYSKIKSKQYYPQIVIDYSYPYVELYKFYSASNVCIFPKETTLSSIHAQVCGAEVIMESQISNEERVINKTLYEPGNFIQAAEILHNILLNKTKDRFVNINKLLDREYQYQISKLFISIGI
jgi:glycosyltransferase involved in cell wall biosynthesis